MHWREDAVEHTETARFRNTSVAVAMMRHFIETDSLDTIKEILNIDPDALDRHDFKVLDRETLGVEHLPRPEPLRAPFGTHIFDDALRKGRYGKVIQLAQKHQEHYGFRDLEQVVTLAVEGILAHNPRSRMSDNRIKDLTDRLLQSGHYQYQLHHHAPRIAAAMYIELGQEDYLDALTEYRPIDVLAAYQDAGMLSEAAHLARSVLPKQPVKMIQELDHPDLYNFRLCLIEDILKNKILTEKPVALKDVWEQMQLDEPERTSIIFRDDPECFGDMLDAIGEPDVFDNDRRTFQEHLYMMIATGAQAKDPWTAYRASKYLRPIRPKLFYKMRTNLIRRRGVIDTDSLLDEFYTSAEDKDDVALLELGERLCEVKFHPDRAGLLRNAVFCFRKADKVPSELKDAYRTALIDLASLNEDVVLYHDEVEYVSAHIAENGNPFTAYHLLRDYEPTDVTREILHRLSIRFQTKWGHLDRAIDCEVAALEGVDNPDYTHLAELFQEQEELDRSRGYNNLTDNDWNLC